MTAKDRLRDVIEALPEERAVEALALLEERYVLLKDGELAEYGPDPGPLSPGDEVAIRRAEDELAAGEGVSPQDLAEALARRGSTPT